MMKSNLFLIGIASGCLLASCSNDIKDLSDPNYNKELGISIPENFYWKTTKDIHVDVNVADNYYGKFNYVVRIYDKQPANGVEPICSGVGNANNPFSAEITVPAAVKTLYVTQCIKQYDNTETEVLQKAIEVNGTSLSCNFAETRSAMTRSGGSSLVISKDNIPADSKFDKIVVYDASTSLDAFKANLKNNTWVKVTIKSNATLDMTNEEIIRNFFGDTTNKNHYCLIIEPGAKLINETNGGRIQVGEGSYIFNDGVINVPNGTLALGNNSTVENNGCINAKIFDFNSSNGVLNMDGYSYIHTEKMIVEQNFSAHMATGAWIYCQTLELESGGSGNPIIFEMKTDQETISGSDYKALFQIGKIQADKNNVTLNINKGILTEVKVANISADKGHVNIASRVDSAEGKIVLHGTTCSGGYNPIEESNLGTYTYAFEDNYPDEGDYDMNDLVLKMDVKEVQSNGYITKLTFKGEIQAVGAVNSIAAFVQLVGVESNWVTSNKEAGTTNAVIKLFDNAHNAIGVSNGTITNTEKEGKNVAVKTFSIDVTLDNETLGSGNLNVEKLDYFIKVNGKEIHLPQYASTDNSVKTYKTNSSIWGVRIPGDFRYPVERTKVIDAYPQLLEWITSSGNNNTEWYKSPSTDKVYK